jgi:hypothetical protein
LNDVETEILNLMVRVVYLFTLMLAMLFAIGQTVQTGEPELFEFGYFVYSLASI